MNNLVWVLRHLKKSFKGKFYITPAVKQELVDRPLETKKFKLEALQTLRLINNKLFTLLPEKHIKDTAKQLLQSANSIYMAKDHPIQIVHYGEMEALAAAVYTKAEAIVIDERTTRKLIEEPVSLQHILEKKLHTHVTMRADHLDEFRQLASGIHVIRSLELVVVAHDKGLLDPYLPERDAHEKLLEAALWAVKLNGCAVSQEEINALLHAESRGRVAKSI
jgi:predicted nucleic acid-binding protein